MQIISTSDYSVTLEMSKEDARRLALACSVATRAAMGDRLPMENAGLPKGGFVEATPGEDAFSLYQSLFEAVTVSILCKANLSRVNQSAFDVTILRRPEPPTYEEMVSKVGAK